MNCHITLRLIDLVIVAVAEECFPFHGDLLPLLSSILRLRNTRTIIQSFGDHIDRGRVRFGTVSQRLGP